MKWILCGLAVAALGVSSLAQTDGAATMPSAGSTPLNTRGQLTRFEMLAAACASSAAAADQKKVDVLLKDITGEIKRLAGQGLEPGKVFDPAVYARLSSIMGEAATHCGIALPAAIALDSAKDDVVRQAAWRLMIEHREYRVSDLPVLCLVYVSSTRERGPMTPPRAWITPYTLRSRQGSWIAQLCGISDLFNEKGDVSLSAQAADPRLWLRSVLQRGIANAKNDQDRAIIAACLLTITTDLTAIPPSPHLFPCHAGNL